MSTINVTVAQARRLLYSQEEWMLEVQRWQAVDRDLFVPIQTYIPSPENILRYLGELDNTGHLLAQAERILAHPGNPNTVYEAQEGHWVAQTKIAERASPVAPPPEKASSEMSEVLSHLMRLQERLERLELRMQGRIADNDSPTPSVRPMNIDSSEPRESTDDEAESVHQTG